MLLSYKVLLMAISVGLLMLAVNAMPVATSSVDHPSLLEDDAVLKEDYPDPSPPPLYPCEKEWVQITQKSFDKLPGEVTLFSVQIKNVAPYGLLVYNLHLFCGPFGSEREVPDDLISRVGENDCLVNKGSYVDVLPFLYASKTQVTLEVSSLQCIR